MGRTLLAPPGSAVSAAKKTGVRVPISRALLALLLAAAFAVAPAQARRHDPNRTDLPTVFLTKPPPDFSYAAGMATHRLSEFTGKPVVLNFWATWCEPCIDELGTFAKISSTYGNSVDVLTVDSEDAGVARKYLQAHGYALPLAEDPTHKIRDLYTVSKIPVTIFIGKDGAVRQVVVGELSWGEIADALDTQLGLTAPPVAATSAAPAAPVAPVDASGSAGASVHR